MSKLQEALAAGRFAVTGELAPPKGYDMSQTVETAKLLRGLVDGVNVTDMQSACLKASSVGLCIHLKQQGLDPILQITGRDRNRMAILGDVLSAASFGIDTVLALTGDHPRVGDCPDSKSVYDLDSVGILSMLSTMERTGTDCGGNPLATVPSLFKGAVVTPVYEPMALQIAKLKKKVDCGAQFIQTQGLFDVRSLEVFLEAAEKADLRVPIMAGIIPLKSAGMARFMNDRVPGIRVPQEQLDRLEAAAREGRDKGIRGLPMKEGIAMAADLIRQLREKQLCAGVHIMTIGAEQNIPLILRQAGIT